MSEELESDWYEEDDGELTEDLEEVVTAPQPTPRRRYTTEEQQRILAEVEAEMAAEAEAKVIEDARRREDAIRARRPGKFASPDTVKKWNASFVEAVQDRMQAESAVPARPGIDDELAEAASEKAAALSVWDRGKATGFASITESQAAWQRLQDAIKRDAELRVHSAQLSDFTTAAQMADTLEQRRSQNVNALDPWSQVLAAKAAGREARIGQAMELEARKADQWDEYAERPEVIADMASRRARHARRIGRTRPQPRGF